MNCGAVALALLSASEASARTGFAEDVIVAWQLGKRLPTRTNRGLLRDTFGIPDDSWDADESPKPPAPTWSMPSFAPAVSAAAAPTGPLDLARIEPQARALGPGLYGYLLWLDGLLASRGSPPMSPWWRYALAEFYASSKRWGVFLVGRGGGKSSTLERVAAVNAFFAPRVVPPGQSWIWPFLSVSTPDAARRIRGLESICLALGLTRVTRTVDGGLSAGEFKTSLASPAHIDTVDARGNAIALMSLAGTIGNVSGPSTIGATIDEAAKLRDREENAAPLTEVIVSLSQTFRARPGIQAICCSSAWHRDGAHYALVEQGDTETNHVARIGEAFLGAAVAGFESVAAWETARGAGGNASDIAAALRIREHAATLTASSPMVPTWVANPTLGSPTGEAWDGAAVASRVEVEAIPEGALAGMTRAEYWLRECGSLPTDGAAGVTRAKPEHVMGLAKIAEELSSGVGRRDVFGGRVRDPWGDDGSGQSGPGGRSVL